MILVVVSEFYKLLPISSFLKSNTIPLSPPIFSSKELTTPADVARLSTFRRDLWPSREAAVTSFRNQSFYKAWDPRVLDRWCEFGLRETPTTLYPDEKPGSVTLRTTKHQECFHFLRPSWEGLSASKTVVDRSKVPDLDPEGPTIYPFYRGEPNLTLEKLGELRPSALYIFGGEVCPSPILFLLPNSTLVSITLCTKLTTL